MDEEKRNITSNDDLPYEVRMKHLIESYRKDLKRLETLTSYAKGLEEENARQKTFIEKNKTWMVENPDQEDIVKGLALRVLNLQGALRKEFPKRVVTLAALHKKLTNMTAYVKELQDLLAQNGIACPERKKDPMELESSYPLESLDIFAVRGPNENFDETTIEELLTNYKNKFYAHVVFT